MSLLVHRWYERECHIFQAQSDFSPQKVFVGDGPPGEEAGSETAEGFICPSCMRGFSSPEALERHYTQQHATGPGAVGGNLADLKDEVQELQTTLKVRLRRLETLLVLDLFIASVSFQCYRHDSIPTLLVYY